MKFTLKDYQTDAERAVLSNLEKARMDWHGVKPYKSAFSLTAVTGAGKTVMAAGRRIEFQCRPRCGRDLV